MKNLILLLSLVSVTSLVQAYPDQIYTIMTCRPAKVVADVGMSLSVEQGGIAGITQITINRFVRGTHKTEQYIVDRKASDPMRAGGPLVYVGKGIELSVKTTTTPNKDGSRPGTLKTAKSSGKAKTEALACKSVSRK